MADRIETAIGDFLSVRLNVDEGKVALREFAQAHEDEVEFDGETITFGTDDETFTLRCDFDHNLEIVYQTVATIYCPTRVAYCSEYKSSIIEAMTALRDEHCSKRRK